MRFVRILFAFLIVAAVVGCQQAQQAPAPAATTASAGPAAQPYGSLAEVMRGIPFPNSNIIFDTQTTDPGAAKKPTDKSSTAAAGGATGVYSSVYSGWQAVEQSAVALSETANLVMIPGRKCENGLPVPLNDETFKKGAKALVEAGQAAYKAAKSKNVDAMVDVSGTVSDACLICHEKYRDVPTGKMRCVPIP
jgi:cytochrome c556